VVGGGVHPGEFAIIGNNAQSAMHASAKPIAARSKFSDVDSTSDPRLIFFFFTAIRIVVSRSVLAPIKFRAEVNGSLFFFFLGFSFFLSATCG